MMWEQALDILRLVLLPVTGAALMLFGVTYLVVLSQTRRNAKDRHGQAPLLLALAVLGVSVGFSTAYSRAPAVGAVMPALLALLSGILTYSVTKEGLAAFRPILPYGITLLSLASLVGLSIGGTQRSRFDDFDRATARELLRYERVELEGEKAKYLVGSRDLQAAALAGARSHERRHAISIAFEVTCCRPRPRRHQHATS